jgi:hypothetical protein
MPGLESPDHLAANDRVPDMRRGCHRFETRQDAAAEVKGQHGSIDHDTREMDDPAGWSEDLPCGRDVDSAMTWPEFGGRCDKRSHDHV